MSVFFLLILGIYIYQLYKKGMFDEFIKNINNSQVNSKPTTQSQKLSYSEQEALKEKIRQRRETKPDPHYIPKEAKVFTSEDIEAYHDVLDECKDDNCDINNEYLHKETNNSCNTKGCDMEDVDTENEVLIDTPLPLIYQLTIAEAILYRKGH